MAIQAIGRQDEGTANRRARILYLTFCFSAGFLRWRDESSCSLCFLIFDCRFFALKGFLWYLLSCAIRLRFIQTHTKQVQFWLSFVNSVEIYSIARPTWPFKLLVGMPKVLRVWGRAYYISSFVSVSTSYDKYMEVLVLFVFCTEILLKYRDLF